MIVSWQRWRVTLRRRLFADQIGAGLIFAFGLVCLWILAEFAEWQAWL